MLKLVALPIEAIERKDWYQLSNWGKISRILHREARFAWEKAGEEHPCDPLIYWEQANSYVLRRHDKLYGLAFEESMRLNIVLPERETYIHKIRNPSMATQYELRNLNDLELLSWYIEVAAFFLFLKRGPYSDGDVNWRDGKNIIADSADPVVQEAINNAKAAIRHNKRQEARDFHKA
jgi:hypothetical protein